MADDATVIRLVDQVGLWPVRLAWFVLPLLVGPGLLATVEGRSDPVRTVVEVAAWAGWFTGLVAVMAPSTVTLTALRILAPATVVGPALGALSDGAIDGQVLLALGAGLIVCLLAFLPSTGDPMVNGSAYGAERRLALRPPASVLIGPLYLVWLIVFAGTLGGPLLLATGNLLAGIPALIIGGGFAFLGVRSLHQLSKRWVVFVPVGFVIHDYWSLAESLLVQRSLKPELSAATKGSPTSGDRAPIDLTAGAYGLTLAVRLPEPLGTVVRDGRQVDATTGTEFWFSPTLPGRVLAEARARAITIT